MPITAKRSSRVLCASATAVGLFVSLAVGCSPDSGAVDTDASEDESAQTCEPCPDLFDGEAATTERFEIDGLLEATLALHQAVVSEHAAFQASVRAIDEAWGVGFGSAGSIDEHLVGELLTVVRGDVYASVDGPVVIDIGAPACSADIARAFDALQECEVAAGCTATPEGQADGAAVVCNGLCRGQCTELCPDAMTCLPEPGSGGSPCGGVCEGSCVLDIEAHCPGICTGTCSTGGEAPIPADGWCEGGCVGICTMASGGSCSGVCQGRCVTEFPNADFACVGGTASCHGTCPAACQGACVGTPVPPSALVECDATLDCQVPASLIAAANLDCASGTLEFAAEPSPGVSLPLDANLDVLEAQGATVLAGRARIHALFVGDGFEPAASVLRGQLEEVLEGSAATPILPALGSCQSECAVSSAQAALEILDQAAEEAEDLFRAQDRFHEELLEFAR